MWMGWSLAVCGCQKPKKCTKSKDKKNPRYPVLPSSALSTELILPGAVSLSRGVAHLLYWACGRLSGLSGMEVTQRSKDEKRMIREKQPGYFCQICQLVISSRRLILSVRVYWNRMALFGHDSQFLQYILGTWQATKLVDETVYEFFFRGIWMKERWETLFVPVNICRRRDVSLKPAVVMWSLQYQRMHYLSPVQTDATLLANNSQHCRMLNVASVCTPCYVFLHVVAQSLKLIKL